MVERSKGLIVPVHRVMTKRAKSFYSPFTIHYSPRPAFTLAEVLITLGIIGVVASLTIPNLIQNAQKEEYVGKIKKTYATIEQAIKLSEIDNGPWQQWKYGTETRDASRLLHSADTYLIPYMSVSENCGSNIGCWVPLIHKFDGTDTTNYAGNTEYAKFILSDGTAI